MATTVDVIRDRIASVCASAPFAFDAAAEPFDFDRTPSQSVDGSFRLTAEEGSVIGGFNYTEDRTDLVTIWVARKHQSNVDATYRTLLTDASSLRAAIVRDGIQQSGEYIVPQSGSSYQIEQPDGCEFSVLRLILPVNFEVQN